MKKYQIIDMGAAFAHAGSKATEDVSVIAEQLGYVRCPLRMRTLKEGNWAKVQRQIGYYRDWKRCLKKIEPGSLVLLQHPFHYPQLIRERCLWILKKKKVRFICIVHDVEELRKLRFNAYYAQEFQFMLKIADVLIVHNEVMKNFFLERGVKEGALISLKIFDYLQENPPLNLPKFERTVVIAGNLDGKKSAYLKQLGNLPEISFALYGGHSEEGWEKWENVHYRGTFPPDHPGEYLTRGLGLVWDGDTLSGCGGDGGDYLRYNNPHKLSLYLSCGLPVVIWENAAEAGFVKEHGVGICVESLWEMKDRVLELHEREYRRMAENAWLTGRKLRQGGYFREALKEAEERLRKSRNTELLEKGEIGNDSL